MYHEYSVRVFELLWDFNSNFPVFFFIWIYFLRSYYLISWMFTQPISYRWKEVKGSESCFIVQMFRQLDGLTGVFLSADTYILTTIMTSFSIWPSNFKHSEIHFRHWNHFSVIFFSPSTLETWKVFSRSSLPTIKFVNKCGTSSFCK